MAICLACGTNSRSTSSLFTSSSEARMLTPVVLPPGEAVLATSPLATRSSAMPADDRSPQRGLLRRPDSGVPERHDKVDVTRHKFAGERGHLLDAHVGPNEIVADIAPLFPPCRLHVTSERLGECLTLLRVDTQHADHRHRPLLRAGHERPRRRRAA